MTLAHFLFAIIIAYFVLSGIGIFFSIKHAPDEPDYDEPRREYPEL